MEVERTRGGLFVPRAVPLVAHRPKKRTITLPSGERALITVDDSGTVQHTETTDRLDVIVRPKTVRIQLRRGGNA